MDIDASVVQLGFLYENPALIIIFFSPCDDLIYFTVKTVLFVILVKRLLPLILHFLG